MLYNVEEIRKIIGGDLTYGYITDILVSLRKTIEETEKY